MTASTPAVPATASWPIPAPQRGLVTRLVAGFMHSAVGVVLAATVLGLSVASSIIARGAVVANPSDVATIQALTPVFALFGVVAFGHVIAGLGIVFGSRSAAALGIGLGAFDAIAGVVALFVAATGSRGRVDGVGIAMTFVVVGIVLAVAARAADWNSRAPAEA